MLVQGVWRESHKPAEESLFCADPNCVYCNDLREAQEQFKHGLPITKSKSSDAT